MVVRTTNANASALMIMMMNMMMNMMDVDIYLMFSVILIVTVSLLLPASECSAYDNLKARCKCLLLHCKKIMLFQINKLSLTG